ncbi:hypothetical protein ACI79S_11490 [Blastococcus sp. SYSU DS1024]
MTTSAGGRTQRLLAVLAVTVALGGCAGEVIRTGDVTVLVAERAEAGMDALGSGRLEVVGGCLGANGYVIVWPSGTEVVEDEPLTVSIPGHGTAALGDHVEVSGGFVLEHSSGTVEPGPHEVAGVTVPAECAEHDVFLAH